MANNFNKLREGMSTESQERSKKKAKAIEKDGYTYLEHELLRMIKDVKAKDQSCPLNQHELESLYCDLSDVRDSLALLKGHL